MKNLGNIVDILKTTDRNQLCTMNPPLRKVEKNLVNVMFFIIAHFIVEFLTFFLLIPYFADTITGVFYLFLLTIICATYFYLTKSNPGYLHNSNLDFLVNMLIKMIENNRGRKA